MLNRFFLDGLWLKKGTKIVGLMILIIAPAFSVSCGKKGPLYIPKKSAQLEQKQLEISKQKDVTEVKQDNLGSNLK